MLKQHLLDEKLDETLVSPERRIKYEMLFLNRSKVLAALIQFVTEKDLFSMFVYFNLFIESSFSIYSVLCLIKLNRWSKVMKSV